ncbi:MAG: hypothetical protein JSW72_02620 [Candidatus Bathyarchaeota archaeon]|nr:MAG: hypothetical protein JSW72_02620 [Candidatus Bathyarchaeota archaeon]
MRASPSVTLEEPGAENKYIGIVEVKANATDNQGVKDAHVRLDNTGWVTLIYDPTDWKYELDTTTLSDRQHTVTVLALDKASSPARAELLVFAQQIYNYSRTLFLGEITMEFNAKFFIFALFLSIAAGIASNIYTWLHYLTYLTLTDIFKFRLFLTPLTLTFSIILPFIFMYFQAKKIGPETDLIPILISAFLGAWIGRLISDVAIQAFIVNYRGGSYGGINILEFGITLTRQIIVLAFSPTVFILATAILLAQYKKWKEAQLPQPPI